MTTYAATTDVSPGRSREEIEATLVRYGCDGFRYTWDGLKNANVLEFRLNNRMIRLYVPMPDVNDRVQMDRLKAAAKAARQSTKPEALYEQAVRQRWRAMLLYVKAILEAIENGVTTLDEALLSGMVLPGGETFGQWAAPQLDRIALEGRMPPLLPGPPDNAIAGKALIGNSETGSGNRGT